VPSEQYGLNLTRIQRGLRRSAERQDYDGLNLRYYVNVYAPAPPITPLHEAGQPVLRPRSLTAADATAR
jgi:hypothetical protein